MKFIIKINNKIVLLKGNPDLLGKGFSNGQGIVESVVAVGILMMVLTGAVLLISSGISSRKVGFDRRKANELATLVMEEQVGKSINEAANFWKLTDILTPQTKPEYPGYSYTLDFTNIFGNPKYPSCGVGKTDCATMVINVGWSGKEAQNLKFERFFSRY